jgi:hypothetical protein
MKATVVMMALAATLGIGSAYAADTNVPGGTVSTPGSAAKGNPILPPDAEYWHDVEEARQSPWADFRGHDRPKTPSRQERPQHQSRLGWLAARGTAEIAAADRR